MTDYVKICRKCEACNGTGSVETSNESKTAFGWMPCEKCFVHRGNYGYISELIPLSEFAEKLRTVHGKGLTKVSHETIPHWTVDSRPCDICKKPISGHQADSEGTGFICTGT